MYYVHINIYFIDYKYTNTIIKYSLNTNQNPNTNKYSLAASEKCVQ